MCATPPSFIPILLKLYRCCVHALKICMWFGYNPQINFCHFFRNLNLAIFSDIFTMKVNGQWVPCVRNSSYSFMLIHLKFYVLWAWSEDMHVVWISSLDYFLSFFSQFELSHFFGHFSEWIEGTLCAQLLLQFNTDTFETLQTL